MQTRLELSLFSMVPCEGKGAGLVATTDIPPGTLLISEPAILALTLFSGEVGAFFSKNLRVQTFKVHPSVLASVDERSGEGPEPAVLLHVRRKAAGGYRAGEHLPGRGGGAGHFQDQRDGDQRDGGGCVPLGLQGKPRLRTELQLQSPGKQSAEQ